MEFLHLNEDCLINLCRYLDAESIVALSDTCSKMKDIAKHFFKFKTSYRCCIGSIENEATVAKTIQRVGKYLMKIDLMFELEYQSSNQLFSVMAKSIGSNLIHLSVLGEICFTPLKILAPILSQLEILTIQKLCWKDDCVLQIDLPSLCPNLRELTVSGQVIFTPNAAKTFNRLVYLDVDFAQKQPCEEVFRGNRQLKKLNLWKRRTINQSISLNDLNWYLVHLEELHLDVGLIEEPTHQLHSVGNLMYLHTLTLNAIPTASFAEISKILETFTRLRTLVLQTDMTRLDKQFTSIQESLVRVGTALKELKSFVTVNIDWTSETVIEFVRAARNLTYFDFWSGLDTNYIVTSSFIRELAEARKSSVNILSQPLNLRMYAMDVHLKQVNALDKIGRTFPNRFPFIVLVCLCSGLQRATSSEISQAVEMMS